jgi:hypothetical protein
MTISAIWYAPTGRALRPAGNGQTFSLGANNTATISVGSGGLDQSLPSQGILLSLTGSTTDRGPYAPSQGNSPAPFVVGAPYLDTTTGTTVFYVGRNSTTGFVDQTGQAV